MSGKKNITDILRKYGWQGDLRPAIKKIRNLTDLNKKDTKIKKEFLARFVDGFEVSNTRIKDALILDIINEYQCYWKQMLLGQLKDCKNASYLYKKIRLILRDHKINCGTSRKFGSLENIIKKEFKSRGVFCLLGCVLPYKEIEIWKKETVKDYSVSLPNKRKKVRVVFLENFITHGWADFATVGVTYPGGWAKKDALYCVKETYDLRTENFKVSYLVHEAQHFDDYKHFPKLQQVDLEYRAKLAELIMANKTFYELLKKFLVVAFNRPDIPHHYASYCLLRDLSLTVFNKKIVRDMDKWKQVSVQDVKTSCKNVLQEHTDCLKQVGSTTVKGIL